MFLSISCWHRASTHRPDGEAQEWVQQNINSWSCCKQARLQPRLFAAVAASSDWGLHACMDIIWEGSNLRAVVCLGKIQSEE